MKKNKGIEFHPTNNQTSPTQESITTKEQYPTRSDSFTEFFNTRLAPTNLTIYYSITSSIITTELQHKVFHFPRENNLLMNNKHIQNNQLMDVAVVYRGHNKYGNTHTMFRKINKALKNIEADGKFSEEQQSVLEEMQQVNSYSWIIMNKRHTYTDGNRNHPRVSTKGMITVVTKPILRVARDYFAMVSVLDPDCLGGRDENLNNWYGRYTWI